MDFKALKHFLHLAESLHFGRSSDALHMSPSTLSRSISRLEQEVGVALFERDNRSVRLTPSGRNFREFAEKTLSEWQAVRQNLNSQTGEITGRIKIYSSVTASYSLMSPILAEFRQQYPAVEVSLKTGDAAFAVDQVLSREVDLAIAPRPDQMPSQLAFFSIKKPRWFLLHRSLIVLYNSCCLQKI